MRTLSLACLCVAALMTGPEAAPRRHSPPQVPTESRLDPRIPQASPAQYRAIREPRDWINPQLDVAHDGYRLTSRSLPAGRFVALDDLRRALIALPITDWPHGRVAVVQLPSLVRVEDIAQIQGHGERAGQVLRALDVDDWGWPP